MGCTAFCFPFPFERDRCDGGGGWWALVAHQWLAPLWHLACSIMQATIDALLRARRRDADAASVSSRASQLSQGVSGAGTSPHSQVSAAVADVAPDDIHPLLAEAARSSTTTPAFLDVVTTIFMGASEATARGQKQRFQVCAGVVDLVDGGAIQNPKVATAAVQRLVPELDTLTFKEVAQLLDAVLAGLKAAGGSRALLHDAACLALVPKLLMRITQGSFVDDDKVQVSGADFKDRVLEQFCDQLDWPEDVAVHIVTVLREVSMTPKVVLRLTEKVVQQLARLPVQDLPAFIYQSLLFASTKPAKVCELSACVPCVRSS